MEKHIWLLLAESFLNIPGLCRLYFWGGVAYFQGGIFMYWQVTTVPVGSSAYFCGAPVQKMDTCISFNSFAMLLASNVGS